MTKIEWTDTVWNPVTGCTKVSPGCAHCYAEALFPRVYAATGRTFGDVECHPDRLDKPLRWRTPRRVFVNSMSDLFHEDVPDEFIDKVFAVMHTAHEHVFQVLTKRPERMREYVKTRQGAVYDACRELAGMFVDQVGGMWCDNHDCCPWPLKNVWLGVSVEDQQRADERIPILLDTPAAVRFLSCEPLLGPVEIRGHLQGCEDCDPCIGGRPDQCAVGSYHLNALHPDGIHWVIVGGESGPKARPCHVEWVRDIVRQCREASVPVFVKQIGARPLWDGMGAAPATTHQVEHNGVVKWRIVLKDRKGGDPDEWPEDLRVREYPGAMHA